MIELLLRCGEEGRIYKHRSGFKIRDFEFVQGRDEGEDERFG
jgi:hypothetical protein